jgi:hypothetical protein
VNAKELLAGSVSIEFAALAVVPITCRSDRPASFLLDLLPLDLPAGVVLIKGEFEGVRRTQEVLILELAGVLIAMLW